MAATVADAPAEGEDRMAWWSTVRWLAELVVLPCRPIILPLLPRPPAAATVTGTILCPQTGDRRVCLCLQEFPASPPLLLLDLPIGSCELAGACRVALECERAQSGGGPLLAARTWAVYCNGRRSGFGTRRAATAAEARALEAMRPVSAGAGILPVPGRGPGDGGFTYLRGRFDRVVGSVDSESYHLVDPAAGCFEQEQEQELSFFFLRA